MTSAVTKTVVSPELISKARTLLAQAKTLTEVLHVRSMAKAYEQYAKAALHSRKVAQEAAEIRLRSERKAGDFLKASRETGLRAGQGGDRAKSHDVILLRDLDVTGKQSSRWQAIAQVPEEVFESYIEERRKSELDELTTSGLMTQAKFHRKAEAGEQLRQAPPPLPDGPFQVIVIDPPWPYSQRRPTNDSRGYPAYSGMTLEEIEALPVASKAA